MIVIRVARVTGMAPVTFMVFVILVMCGHIGFHRLFIVSGCLALDDRDRILRAGTYAVTQSVTVAL